MSSPKCAFENQNCAGRRSLVTPTNIPVAVLANGSWGGLVKGDPLQGLLVTSHEACSVLRNVEIRDIHSVGKSQVPACIASAF
jgi:hypothetical protein